MLYSNISWTQAKSLKTANASLQFYYTQIGFGPNEYIVILGNNSQCLVDVVASADVTDFETNYKASAISVVTPNDALSILDTGVPPTPIKTNVLKTGALVTTAVTVDQVILTYTVTTGKTFYVTYAMIVGAQTAPTGGTNVVLGTASFETPSGTKIISRRFLGGGGTVPDVLLIPLSVPLPIISGTVIRAVVTPIAVTSFTWSASFGGYEV